MPYTDGYTPNRVRSGASVSDANGWAFTINIESEYLDESAVEGAVSAALAGRVALMESLAASYPGFSVRAEPVFVDGTLTSAPIVVP